VVGVGVNPDDAAQLERIERVHDEDETSETGREAFHEEVYFRVAHRHRATLLRLLREQIAENKKLRAKAPVALAGERALAFARLR